MITKENSTYGFALSGGGSRGFAHLGAIKALSDNGIQASALSGTSAGAIVSAFLADGYLPGEILEIFQNQKIYHILGLSLPKKGLGSITGLEKLLKKHLRAKNIEDLDIPSIFTATDLNNGKAVHFSRGELIPRLIASASIPILFQPVTIDNVSYVDGGVMDMLPWAPLKGLCQKIVGIDVNPGGYRKNFSNLISIAERVFYLSFSHQNESVRDSLDLYIEIRGIDGFSWFDLSKSQQIYELGYQETLNALKKTQDA